MSTFHSPKTRTTLVSLCAAALLTIPASAQEAASQGPVASAQTPGQAPTGANTVENWEVAEDGAMRMTVGPRTAILATPDQHMVSEPEAPALKNIDLQDALAGKVSHDLQAGEHWAMGSDYKVSASPDGFVFMPFLGSEVPKTFEFKMRLESASLGGEPIVLTKQATVNRSGERMILDRGPVDVFYDLSSASVEQSFELEVAGVEAELVLNIGVESELALQSGEHGAYFGGEHGGVTYRHAVVIDGAGHRLELPIQASQGNLRLTVPASFMRDSVAPVIVDPIISTYQVHGGSTLDRRHPDVAYDYDTDVFAYVHQQAFSASDNDVWLETHSVGTPGSVDLQIIDISLANVLEPNVASDNTSDQFLVVSRRKNNDDRWEVIGRMADATDISRRSATFVIGNTNGTAGDTWGWTNLQVDVGGKSQGAPLFKVVWDRRFYSGAITSKIRSTTVTPTVPFVVGGIPVVSALEIVSSPVLANDMKVKISESSGDATVAEWRIVFIRDYQGSPDQELHTALYADDNTLTMAAMNWHTINTGWTAEDLDVSTGLSSMQGPLSSSPVYMVALQAGNAPVEADIWTYGLQDGDFFTAMHLTRSEHQNESLRPRNPAVATMANRFAVSYVEYDVNNPGYKCYTSSMDLTNTNNFAVAERREEIADLGTNNDFVAPGTVSRFSGGAYYSRYVSTAVSVYDGAVWTQEAAVNYHVQASSAGHQYCLGFPNTTGDYGFIRIAGSAETTGTKTLFASTMPLNQFGYFLVGQGGFGQTVPAGSAGKLCILGGAIGRYNQGIEVQFTGTSGAFSLPIDPTAIRSNMGNVVGTSGTTYNFQAWHRENGGSSNFTNAVSLTFN